MTPSSADEPEPLTPAAPADGDGGEGLENGRPDPWHNRPRVVPPHSEHFGELVASLRRVMNLVTGANPPDDVVRAATEELDDLASTLEPWLVGERDAPAGKLDDEPGRAQPVLLPFVRDEETPNSVRGHVRFTRSYLGGNGAAHGGTVPLLFDEVLGRLSNNAGRAIARTAYLHVNYRKITPIDVDLQIEAQFDREEGRKRWISGTLKHGDELIADAEGLWVILLPGQP